MGESSTFLSKDATDSLRISSKGFCDAYMCQSVHAIALILELDILEPQQIQH